MVMLRIIDDQGKGNKYGLMGLDIRGNGRIIMLKEKENSPYQMAAIMRENGSIMLLMAMAFLSIIRMKGMRENGRRTNLMGKGNKHGKM